MRVSLFVTVAALALHNGPDPLTTKLAAIAKTFPGQIGIAVRHLESGKAAGLRENERFPTQSVYKLPIAMAALRKAKALKWPVSRIVPILPVDVVPGSSESVTRDRVAAAGPHFPLSHLVTFAVSDSDNTASDVLLRFAGGPAAVSKGLTGWQIGTTLKDFDPARNTVTPHAALALLTQIQQDPANAAVLSAMVDCSTGLKRLKGQLPPGTPVAHKTGTGGRTGTLTLAINDVGLITLPNRSHVAIAVFVKDAAASQDACERVIARLARTTWDHYTQKP